MITGSPRANMWLDVPADCRFESSVLSEDEIRMVIGHPGKDGHTLEIRREALRRLHAVAGDTLEALDNGSWLDTNDTRISEPGQTVSNPSTPGAGIDPPGLSQE